MKNMDSNSFNINNWKTYYINLDKRKDRRENIEAELAKQGIVAERFSALSDDDDSKCPDLKFVRSIDATTTTNLAYNKHLRRTLIKGEWGCVFSHYSILKKHLNSKSDKILAIFEDDAHFCADFKERLKYLEDNFNLDWDIFYLSSSIRLPYNKKTDIKHVWKIEDLISCTHAMLFNPKSLPKIIKLIELHGRDICVMDSIYSFLMPQLNAYCFIPGLVAQDMNTPGDINSREKITSAHIRDFGEHVFSERLEDYDYKKTNWVRARLDFYFRQIWYRPSYLFGSIGRKIESVSPTIYKLLKPYFPDKIQ